MDIWVPIQLHLDPIPGASLTVLIKKKKKVKGEIQTKSAKQMTWRRRNLLDPCGCPWL